MANLQLIIIKLKLINIKIYNNKLVYTSWISVKFILSGWNRPKRMANVSKVGAQTIPRTAGLDGEEGRQNIRNGLKQ